MQRYFKFGLLKLYFTKFEKFYFMNKLITLDRINYYILNKLGYHIKKSDDGQVFPVECSEDERNLISSVQEFSMSSNERFWSLISSVKYINENLIEGDFVECGVWRGGNLILMQKLINKYKLF